MKKTYQNPIDIDKQIENLKTIDLEINDINYAKQVLKRISYYRLIKAYSITLKEKGKYVKGTKFEDIVNLYKFDVELRHLIFIVIEYIEVALRAEITNHFSLKYGNFGYQEIANFDKEEEQKKVLNDLRKEINRNKRSPFIKNFKDNYKGGEVPLYACIEVASFGTLSKMYKNMKSEDKVQIAKAFNVDYHYFESWIENFAYIRNICAHYGRLYGAKLTKSPKLYKEYLKQHISNNTLIATIINLKIISEEEKYKNFYDRLLKLTEKYNNIDLKHIGFPKDFNEILCI